MKWFAAIPCFLLLSVSLCMGEPIQALRFEGVWKLNGPDPLSSRLEFQVNGEAITATYYHPQPSSLSDIRIEGDRFTATYLDEFAAQRTLTAQVRGATLEVSLAPAGGRNAVVYSGARIAPDPTAGAQQRAGGTINRSGKNSSGEFTFKGHTIAVSGGKDGDCVSASFGVDGKGVSLNGCFSGSARKP